MFFLIPIGSEEGVRKLPVVTIGLIAANAIIWIATALILGGQVRRLELQEEKMIDFLTPYTINLITSAPELLNAAGMDQVIEQVETLKIIPQDSEDYPLWKQMAAQWQAQVDGFIYNRLGFRPRAFNLLSLFTSLFVHGGFLHLAFNMLYLWLVGCNIEDDWSWKIFLGLYLASGAAAGLMHAGAFPNTMVPLIGASGAIAGVMGAFMVRHFKTRIRIAYFFWFFYTRPYWGTFPIYAGIALPVWFLIQFLFARFGGSETGTAYWAHVGGFLFGMAVGIAFKFLGIEKKYIAPMVEETFEKLKFSPKMKEAVKKLEHKNLAGANALLLEVMAEEPKNADVPHILARLYSEKGQADQAAAMYNKALDLLLADADPEAAPALYEELQEKDLLDKLTEKNLFGLGQAMEKAGKAGAALSLYERYDARYPSGRVRAKVIFRIHVICRDQAKDSAKAQAALDRLRVEFPDYPIARPEDPGAAG